MRDALSPKYLDHELRYPVASGDFVVFDAGAAAYLVQKLNEIQVFIAAFTGLFDKEAQDRAFGPPGTEGDADRIHQLAFRLTSGYEFLMDWAARIRGVIRPTELSEVFELMARFSDLPVNDYRAWVDEVATKFDAIPAAVASKVPTNIEVSLVLRMDDGVLEAFNAELHRLSGLF